MLASAQKVDQHGAKAVGGRDQSRRGVPVADLRGPQHCKGHADKLPGPSKVPPGNSLSQNGCVDRDDDGNGDGLLDGDGSVKSVKPVKSAADGNGDGLLDGDG